MAISDVFNKNHYNCRFLLKFSNLLSNQFVTKGIFWVPHSSQIGPAVRQQGKEWLDTKERAWLD